MSKLFRDIRYGLRALGESPGFAGAAVLAARRAAAVPPAQALRFE